MESAFGIDHGYDEIEKGFKIPGLGAVGGAIGRGVERYGTGVRQAGASQLAAVRKTPGLSPGAAKGTRAGAAFNVKSGGRIRSLGQKMQARPGLTGGLAVGGGAAGIGGAGAAFGNRRKQY